MRNTTRTNGRNDTDANRQDAPIPRSPARTYAQLVAVLPPWPLHDATDYDNAVEMLGNLIGFDLNRDQEDYLLALDTFIEQYEPSIPRHERTRVR